MRKDLNWYAIETFPGKDELAEWRAHVVGFVAYRPTEVVRVKRQRRCYREIDPSSGAVRGEKRCDRIVPLFGNYVFIQLEMNNNTRELVLRMSASGAPLVRRWLCYAGTNEPARIPAGLIEMLGAPISREGAREGAAFVYRVGQRVVMVTGSFAGIEGTVREFDKRGNLVVEVELLGCATPLPLKVAHVRPRSSQAKSPADRASNSLLSQTA